MVKFATPDMIVSCPENPRDAQYRIGGAGLSVNVNGSWRSRPRGRRLFTDDQIRAIRFDTRSARKIADDYGCSHVLIRYIKKRSIYEDVV